jgi:alpha-galactosidase
VLADGVDVLERLKQRGYCRSDDQLPGKMKSDDPMPGAFGSRAVFALWRELGYMPGINDRHIIENLPWFLTDPAGKLEFGIVRTSIEERYEWRRIQKERVDSLIATGELGRLGHGDDPIVTVIESLSGRRSFLYGSNFENIGQIPQLPAGAVVETRCRFDAAGVSPLCSPMPRILQTLVLPHVLRQEAIIDIALTGSFDELVALVTTDPLCSRLRLGQVRRMVAAMLQANRKYIKNPRLLES